MNRNKVNGEQPIIFFIYCVIYHIRLSPLN